LWPQPPINDPHIIVYKSARKLELYSGKTLLHTYRVGLGFNPVADKQREGDGATPAKAQHDAILEAIRKKKAPPQYTKLGGLIYIHGNGAGRDWTWGCVALEDEDMKELYDAVSVGTRVTIKP